MHVPKVATLEEILALGGNMNINFYVKKQNTGDEISFAETYQNWQDASVQLNKSMQRLFESLTSN